MARLTNHLSESEQAEVLKKWRDKLRLSIDDNGFVRAGWGYPQSVPEIQGLSRQELEEGTTDLERVLDALNRTPRE